MTQLDDLKLQANAVGNKIYSLLFLKYFLFWGALAGFTCGLYFLVTNVIGYESKLSNLIIFAVLTSGALLTSFILANRRRPSTDRIINLLDRVNHGGGMLLSAPELIESGWNNKLIFDELPVIKLRSPKAVTIFAGSLLFALAAYLAPPAVKSAIAGPHLNIKNETETLTEQLQLLEEEKIITRKEAANLREQMEKMEKNAAGEDPVKTWEALDHIKESLSTKTEEFAEKTARKAEALTLSQKALQALKDAKSKTSPGNYDQAMQEMATLMQKVLAKCPKLSEKLSKECKDMLSKGKLNKEALEELLKSGQLTQKQLEELLKKLKEKGLCDNLCDFECDSGKAGKTKMITRENFDELMKMLDEEPGECEAKECSMTCLMAVCLGTGSISRGRGDAPMTWSDKEINRDDVKFKAMTLPADAVNGLKKSKLLGVSYGEAKADPNAKISTGHLSGVQVKGTKTNRFILMPRHRTVIKKYFDKNK